MKREETFLYISYGAIGDVLMFVLLLDKIHGIKGQARFVIAAARNYGLIKDLASEYKWLEVVDASRLSVILGIFIRSLGSYFNVIMSPTFGVTPLKVALFSKLVSLRNWRVSPVGFIEKEGVSQRLYARRIEFDIRSNFLDNIAKVLPIVGIDDDYIVPNFKFKENFGLLERYSLNGQRYIVIHLCAANPVRSLPVDRWVGIVRKLSEKMGNIKIVFTASIKDITFVKEVISGSGVVNFVLIENASLHDIAGVIKYSNGYVGVDTGITHVASVQGVSSVVVGNNSNPCWLPTYNKNAVILVNNSNCLCKGDKSGGCYYEYLGAKYYRCMFDVSDEEVVSESMRLFFHKPE